MRKVLKSGIGGASGCGNNESGITFVSKRACTQPRTDAALLQNLCQNFRSQSWNGIMLAHFCPIDTDDN